MRKMNRYLLLADGVAVFHAAYVAFVTIGFALIAAGIAMRWEWVRAFWFRVAHLGAIAFVCAESLMGTACPLTTLEGQLRAMSGEASHSRDFVGYWVDRLRVSSALNADLAFNNRGPRGSSLEASPRLRSGLPAQQSLVSGSWYAPGGET